MISENTYCMLHFNEIYRLTVFVTSYAKLIHRKWCRKRDPNELKNVSPIDRRDTCHWHPSQNLLLLLLRYRAADCVDGDFSRIRRVASSGQLNATDWSVWTFRPMFIWLLDVDIDPFSACVQNNTLIKICDRRSSTFILCNFFKYAKRYVTTTIVWEIFMSMGSYTLTCSWSSVVDTG